MVPPLSPSAGRLSQSGFLNRICFEKCFGDIRLARCAASSRPCSQQSGQLRSELRSGPRKAAFGVSTSRQLFYVPQASSLGGGRVSAASQAPRNCNQLSKQLCSQHRTQLKKQPVVACCHGRFEQKTKKDALPSSCAEVPNHSTASRSTLQPASSKKKRCGANKHTSDNTPALARSSEVGLKSPTHPRSRILQHFVWMLWSRKKQHFPCCYRR